MLKRSKALALIAAFALLLNLIMAETATAAGPDALYQVGFSENCDNSSFCGPNLGGFWGWGEFDTNGTGIAELVGCSHMLGGGAAAGAQHFHASFSWTIQQTPAGPFFFTYNETDTFTGRNGGPPVSVFNPTLTNTGIPAAPGHYTASMVFGFTPPPGVSVQIQVAKNPVA